MKHQITILGSGSMGTALSHLFAYNGYPVVMWSVEDKVIQDINRNHKNSKYLVQTLLPKNVRATANLQEALTAEQSVIVLALPAQAVAKVAKTMAPMLASGVRIVSVAKGLEQASGFTVSQILKRELSVDFHNQISVLMGPLFASEIAQKIPSVGILATGDKENFNFLRKIFQNEYFFTRYSEDVLGAELGGALKNVYAILLGVCDGLGFGWNTKSAVLTAAMREMAECGRFLGARRETLMGLSGMGDLLTTGFGEKSRNRRFGEKICSAKSVQAILKEIGQVVEGVKTVDVALKLLREYKKELPLMRAVHSIVHQKKNPCAVFNMLLKRHI